MFLATTALGEFLDKSQKVLFLGPWCLTYARRAEWSKLDYQVMENPWDDRDKFLQAAYYTNAIYEQLMKYLTTYLNRVHKTTHSERYWRILIGLWLLSYIQAVYDRYYHLRLAFQNHRPLETWCLSSACFITPQNARHFVELYTDDFYNLQLYSQILKVMGYNFPTKEFYYQRPLSKSAVKCQVIKGLYSAINNQIAKRKKILLNGFPITDGWKIIFASCGQAWSLKKQWGPYWPNLQHVDYKVREGLKDSPASDEFSKILVQTLPINFPKSFLEGYQRSCTLILQEWKRFPKVIMSFVSWDFDVYFKFLAAEACEKNTRLLLYQHGGGYGSGKIPVEDHEIKISDIFYSWGWTSKEYLHKVRPLPNPRLSRQFSKGSLAKRLSSKTILFVGTNLPRYTYYFYSVPVNSQFDHYLSMQKEFVHSLSSAYRSFLLFRLYRIDYGQCEVARLREEFANLRFDDHRLSLAKQFFRARIVVFDHPLTSYLEALSNNFPCILFWNPNYWEMRDEAVPFFERLRQAGILFDNAKDAAGKLMQVYDESLRWWLSEEVQSARKAFVARFALGSNDWIKHWINEFKFWSDEKVYEKV